jgi:class 3 adenylate cyclase
LARRLAATVAADVVGYSRLLKQDEAGTLAALLAWDLVYPCSQEKSSDA